MPGVKREARSVPRTFLFSDLRGYTAFVERSGDAAASRLLKTYRDLVRRAVARYEGAEVKTEGDSFYVVFESSAAAVSCAIAIQRAAARRRRDPLAIGIGIHVGEATPFDQQYVGSAVNVAARLASAAVPGEILISETVRGLIRTAVHAQFEDRGALRLKGIVEPIHAYAIRVAEPTGPPELRTLPTTAMEALIQGDPDAAGTIARALSPGASIEERCAALAALTILAAARGDVETALGQTERLLALSLRASERSWVRAVYALRSWLYFLARQPGEAVAELERAFARPGSSTTACLGLLLAVTLGGSAAHAEHLRQVARSSSDRTVETGCAAVAEVLEGRTEASGVHHVVAGLTGPFLGAVVELQLCLRFQRQFLPGLQAEVSRAGADRLAELIFEAMQ